MAAGDVVVTNTTNRSFSGFYFDGINDYLQTGINIPILNLESSPVSISLWAKWVTIPTGNYQAFFGNKSSSAYFQCTNGTGNFQVTFTIRQADLSYKNSTIFNPAKGVWYHLVGIAPGTSAGNVVLYVNGTITGVGTAQTDTLLTNPNGFRLGCNGGATGFVNIEIANVRIYKKVLDSIEIANLYAGIAPTSSTSKLVAEWKLNNSLIDTSIESNNLSIVNNAHAGLFDDAIATAVKAQRVASTDKWLCARGQNGQVIVANIE